METTDTKKRLLDVAEQLFAEHGIDATSLRTITAGADANLAAVHYYFGSKEGLVKAMFERRFEPLNQDRLRLLDAFEAVSGEAPLKAEQIIEAFIAPALEHLRNRESKHFMKLMGRIYADPSEMSALIHEHGCFIEVIHRFIAALRRSLPYLPPDETVSRFKFMVGAMIMILVDPVSSENAPPVFARFRSNTRLEHFIMFLAAGMRAPATEIQETKAESLKSNA